MSASWIRMRVDLAHDPKIIAVARDLYCDDQFIAWLNENDGGPNVLPQERALLAMVIGGVFQLWAVARQYGKFEGDDVLLPHTDITDLHQLTGIYRLGEALVKIGWLVEEDAETGLRLPRFREFNSPKTDAERQHDWRERHRGEKGKDARKRPKQGAKLDKPKETWATPYFEAWRQVYGFAADFGPQFGPASKHLQKCELTHGVEKTLQQFRAYIASHQVEYLSWSKWAAGFGRWGEQGANGQQKSREEQSRELAAAREEMRAEEAEFERQRVAKGGAA